MTDCSDQREAESVSSWRTRGVQEMSGAGTNQEDTEVLSSCSLYGRLNRKLQWEQTSGKLWDK